MNDHALLRERLARLTGAPGLARLDTALASARNADPYEPSSASEVSSASGAESPSPQKRPMVGIVTADLGSKGAASSHPLHSTAIKASADQPSEKPRSGIARGFFGKSMRKRNGSAVKPPNVPPVIPSPLFMPGLSAEAVANLSMVNDLLHSPDKRLPYDEIDASLAGLWGGDAGSNSARAAGARGLIDPLDLEGLSPDEAIALVQSKAKAVAEGVFWDNVAEQVQQRLQVRRLHARCRSMKDQSEVRMKMNHRWMRD